MSPLQVVDEEVSVLRLHHRLLDVYTYIVEQSVQHGEKPQPLTLRWNNLSYSVKNKTILRDVSGEVHSGEMLAGESPSLLRRLVLTVRQSWVRPALESPRSSTFCHAGLRQPLAQYVLHTTPTPSLTRSVRSRSMGMKLST